MDCEGQGRPQGADAVHPSAVVLVCLGFTTSTTFMLWINCNQELGALYGLTDPSRIQSFYSVGIVLALFASATLLKRNVEPAKTLVAYPTVALATLVAIYLVQEPVMCLAGSFLLGFFAAGGVLQLGTAVANEMFPKKRGVITPVCHDRLQRGQLSGGQRGGRPHSNRRYREPPASAAVQHGGDVERHPASPVPQCQPEAGAARRCGGRSGYGGPEMNNLFLLASWVRQGLCLRRTGPDAGPGEP